LFNVIDCKLSWQKRGDYLVVKVDRYTKKSGEKNNPKYSGLIYNFEIFHMREKNVPLDTLEVKGRREKMSWILFENSSRIDSIVCGWTKRS